MKWLILAICFAAVLIVDSIKTCTSDADCGREECCTAKTRKEISLGKGRCLNLARKKEKCSTGNIKINNGDIDVFYCPCQHNLVCEAKGKISQVASNNCYKDDDCQTLEDNDGRPRCCVATRLLVQGTCQFKRPLGNTCSTIKVGKLSVNTCNCVKEKKLECKQVHGDSSLRCRKKTTEEITEPASVDDEEITEPATVK